eukprot:CAMPEP_0182452162 /NCGR_PEP_ID=MMETSP1172-20130603/44104_1 /TAXON_ID=708627 /ORGANISM="Timspurckia oligopyrenoides, Strain CCMP3278" /LENGTH=66 /DNA_ID=CAMNT_0024649979 /DNA_START=248 /DNA_END=448 /DNA_ORIENTATION=+
MSNVSSPRIARAQESVKLIKVKLFRFGSGSRDESGNAAVRGRNPLIENQNCQDMKFAIDLLELKNQ